MRHRGRHAAKSQTVDLGADVGAQHVDLARLVAEQRAFGADQNLTLGTGAYVDLSGFELARRSTPARTGSPTADRPAGRAVGVLIVAPAASRRRPPTVMAGLPHSAPLGHWSLRQSGAVAAE